MKQIAYVQIQVEKDENLYIFSMPMGASLADASEVSFRMFKAIDKMYRDAIDKELEKQGIKSQEAKDLETKIKESETVQAEPLNGKPLNGKSVGNGT